MGYQVNKASVECMYRPVCQPVHSTAFIRVLGTEHDPVHDKPRVLATLIAGSVCASQVVLENR